MSVLNVNLCKDCRHNSSDGKLCLWFGAPKTPARQRCQGYAWRAAGATKHMYRILQDGLEVAMVSSTATLSGFAIVQAGGRLAQKEQG